MNYSEAAYFDGNHCAHVAAYMEKILLADRVNSCLSQLDRRKSNVFVPIERRRVSNYENAARETRRRTH